MPNVASNRLSPAKMAETDPKKGAELLISADLGAAGGVQEPLAVVDGTGCECQGWGSLWVTGSGAGVGLMFKELLGTLTAEQSGHSLGMHVGIFRAHIATCADLLELVD